MVGMIRNISFNGVQNIKRVMTQNIAFQGRVPGYLEDALNGDTFVKSAQEPFDNEKAKAETPNGFIEWANETDFIKSGMLKEALKPENLIGEGFEHAVYNIPGNDDFVLRIKRGFYKETQKFDYDNYDMEDTRDMELDGNYGQQVAVLSDKDKSIKGYLKPSIEVLKKQKGFPNGNPSPRALYNENGTLREEVLPYEDDSRKRHFARSINALAQMPDETYDQLIEDLLVSGEAGYKFDPENSNNFLIDEENQRINIIDMSPAEKPHKDRFGNTLYALINLEFLGEYMRSGSGYEPENPNEINDTIGKMFDVIDKYTDAMKKKLQKFNMSSFRFNDFMHNPISSFWLRTGDFDEKVNKLREMGLLYEGKRDY